MESVTTITTTTNISLTTPSTSTRTTLSSTERVRSLPTVPQLARTRQRTLLSTRSSTPPSRLTPFPSTTLPRSTLTMSCPLCTQACPFTTLSPSIPTLIPTTPPPHMMSLPTTMLRSPTQDTRKKRETGIMRPIVATQCMKNSATATITTTLRQATVAPPVSTLAAQQDSILALAPLASSSEYEMLLKK